MGGRKSAFVALAGGALGIVGSLLPWVTVRSGFGSVSVAGLDGDGKITLGLAFAVVVLALLMREMATWAAALVGIVMGFVAVYDWTRLEKVADQRAASVSVGGGLVLVVVGAGLTLFGYVLTQFED